MHSLTRYLSAVSMAVSLLAFGSAQAANPVMPNFIAQGGGKVVQVKKAEAGMTAITIEKDGKQGVVFTSQDNSIAFFGVMFDAKTGANISDKYMPKQEQATRATEGLNSGGKAETEALSSKRIQEHLAVRDDAKNAPSLHEYLLSDKVPGILEGKASKTTSFVFFDPQCSFCHKLYSTTRPYVKTGASIKWIPVNILGDDGLPVSVEMLKRGPTSLKDLVGGKLDNSPMRPLPKPMSVERAQIDNNTTFLYMMTEKMKASNPKLSVATPTIFYAVGDKISVGQSDGTKAQDKPFMEAAFGKPSTN